jgi:DNA-binding CsgD family transcriptional regulator
VTKRCGCLLVEAVSGGERPQDNDLELFTAEEWKALASHFGLTRRQREIARLICQGDSRVRIARFLRIAAETVHTHTKEVFRKAGVKNRVCFVVRLVLADRAMQVRTRA